jgi:two-component system CheB/CheR fusion protein
MGSSKYWVGIGASAGGLEALKELTQTLHKDNAVYIIAQHLDPKHPTILKDLLERVSPLAINMIDEDTVPREGEIYIISPGHNAIIENGTIILKPAAAVGPKPSINEFFTSLASELEDRSIGVILSGTGSDGAEGIIAIKAAGGIAFSQDELSAKYSGMPRAAIETGMVDFVLSPSEISEEIQNFLNSSSIEQSKFSGPKVRTSLEKIFQRLYDQTNYDFSGYKIKTVQRRIQRRMVVNKVITLDDYLTLLLSSTAEVENLFKELLISVTAFFRDDDAFKDLNEVVLKLVKESQPGETLRIWVPGCAKGEEAYSIAILFQEAIYTLNKEAHYQIFATDIDDHSLSKARQGVYTFDQVKDIDPKLLKRYFNEYESSYLIKKELRDHMVFAKQNLIMDPPFSHLDLISCRNVMIYFNLDTQKRVFQTFHFALKENRWLFLGKSESASNTVPELFELEKAKSQVFRRRLTDLSRKSGYSPDASAIASYQNLKNTPTTLKIKEVASVQQSLEETLVKKVIPTAVVLNSQGQMLHVRGDINRFLSIPEGRMDNNILTMARDNLKIDIRALMQRSKRDDNASAQALFYQHEYKNHILYMTMTRLNNYENDDLFVLAFFDLKVQEGISPNLVHKSLKDLSSEELQKEVEIFKERLQSSIQDLETTNEELQSSNEELQSANEELQSANEELQTANEELQSTNEELSTVNEELEVKSFELAQVNNDLESMLWSIDDIILFIDTRLRIQRYTNKAAEEFRLSREDIGQVITSYDLSIDIPNIRVELLNVIEKEKETRIELRSKNLHYNLRLVAYKAGENEVVGVILFFEKLSHNRENQLVTHKKMLHLIDENTPHPMICTSQKHAIVYASERFSKMIGYEPSELEAMHFDQLLVQHNLVDHFVETEDTDVQEWRAMTLIKKDAERIQVKFKINRCPNPDYSETIVFFQLQE